MWGKKENSNPRMAFRDSQIFSVADTAHMSPFSGLPLGKAMSRCNETEMFISYTKQNTNGLTNETICS